jgi:hypothetical protein
MPPLRAESSTRCNLIAPHVTAPLVDASGETGALRGLSLSRSCSLDGNAWSRRGTMTYPRIPTKSEGGLEEKYTINVLKKVAPAIPQLRAADAAYTPTMTCPLRLAKA